jgi:PBP1b-binding outer membrane lipoprotein LpoB
MTSCHLILNLGGIKMKKIFVMLLLILFVFSCGKEKQPEKVEEKKPIQENLFKNIDVDKLSKRLENEIEAKGMKVDSFDDLNSDGKVFYYSTLNGNKDEIITINYENLTPTAMVGKIAGRGKDKMESFKNLSLALIRASDTNLTDEDAQIIYEELLNKLENTTSSTVVTKNDLTYGIEVISGVDDELVIYAK